MTIRRARSRYVRILWLALAASLFVAQLAAAQSRGSAWEGAGAVGSSGEFPPAGLYAASDTFPRNSIVDVLNLDTGESVRILVVKKLDVPGLFMLVSPDAAKSLGMNSSSTSRLRVTPVMMPGLADMNLNRDLPYSPDPDLNPAASVADPNAAIRAERSEVAAAPPAVRPEPPVISPAPQPQVAPAPSQTVPAPAKPEAPQQDILTPGAENAARAAGNTTPQAGSEVVPRVAARPEPSLPSTLPPTQPKPLSIAESPNPPAAATAQVPATSPVGSGTAAGPAAPLPTAEPQTAHNGQIGNPAVPQPPQSIAEASPQGRTPPSQELPGGGVALPSTPSGAAESRPSTPAANLYTTPDASNPAAAEISRLEDRTPQKALFVPPRPEDTAVVLSPPPAPSRALSINPSELAVATPVEGGRPVAGALPQLAAPAGGEPKFISQLPGTPGTPKAAQSAPPTGESARGPEASQIVPPSRYQEPALSGALPLAQAPGTETPSVTEMQPQPATESPSGAGLPIASARQTETPELGGLGPIAPPKPAAAVAEAFQPPSPSAAPPPAAAQPSPGGGEITLVPAQPRPPAASAPGRTAPQAPATRPQPSVPASVPGGEAWAQRNLPLVSVLQNNYYYVQIGAFESPQSAKDALDRVAPGYPVVVLPVKEHGRTVYRLFVGPLNDDEKGAALYWFKAKGYNDAFVRRGGES